MENSSEIKEYFWPERLQGYTRAAKSIRYYVDDNGCWICISHVLDKSGYPKMMVNRRTCTIHHHIWEYEHDRKVKKGLLVRHLCNNPKCINPAHLREGTPAQNTMDAVRAGRWQQGCRFKPGERHPNHKLTEDQVRYIRRNPEKKLQRELGIKFGVDRSTIGDAQRGRHWSYLSLP